MDPSMLFDPVQRLFDSAREHNRVEPRTRFLFYKSLVAKVNLAPSGPVIAAEMEAVANTNGKLSTYRLFLLEAMPQYGPNIYHAVMIEHLFRDQPPEIMDGVYEVDPQTNSNKPRADLAPPAQEALQTGVVQFLQSTQVLQDASPAQSILQMLLTTS